MSKIISIFCILAFACIQSIAQTGNIKGTVFDVKSSEAVPFANVIVTGTTTGTTTELDGTYSLDLEPGTYSISVSYIGYADYQMNDVIVTSGQTTALDVKMEEEGQLINEVVVVATTIKNTENALLNIQKLSSNVIDGVSSQSFSRSGDGNAASALSRVTGVAVNDGKDVVVRGLGDRYTKTILNNMELPGIDPDRNNIQMDLFPTNSIDNIVVYKTFTPELAGDFTGGTIDVKLKDFPDDKFMNVSASMGFNSVTTFNSNFQSYNSSSADAFALGANSRSLPINKSQSIGLISNPAALEANTRAFDNNMSVTDGSALPNGGLNISVGNKKEVKKGSLGYILSAGYNNSNQHYDQAIFNDYLKDIDKNVNKLFLSQADTGSVSQNTVLWNTMASFGYKTKKAAYSAGLFHVQTSTKTATEILSTDYFLTSALLDRDVLYYNQRSITNAYLKGSYSFSETLEGDITVSPSISNTNEPDLRTTTYSIDDEGLYTLNYGDGAQVSRIYRGQTENSFNTKANIKKTIELKNGRETVIKGGLAYLNKERNFEVYQYNFRDLAGGPTYSGEPNDLFLTENLYSAQTQSGLYVFGQPDSSNIYLAKYDNIAAYVMNELPITSKLKVVYGLRGEKSIIHYSGERQDAISRETTPDLFFDNRKLLDNLDLLPSVNLTYELMADMNLRLSYSKTLARPSFKEISSAQIYDPVTNRTFIGNPDLVQTYIQNMDIRWEYFFNRGEILSLSGFYKQFENPIEIGAYSAFAPDNITPRNVAEATVYGVEVEFRKNLETIAPFLKPLSISTNLTLVHSEVMMSVEEYESRKVEARTGETISNTRQIQGQAPYVINAGLNYVDKLSGWEGNVSYNVQGKSLRVVGIARNADVYTLPFHALNCKISKQFGEAKKIKAGFAVTNLLNQFKQSQYESFEAEPGLFEYLRPGRTLSASISYRMY
jgi:TonB-dependent receptor